MSSLSEETDIDLFSEVDEKALAGADFTAEVIGELRRAFNGLRESSDLTQKAVADRLGVSKTAVHRWLHGDGNMTVRKLGEFVWAMRCRSTLKITADLDHDLPVGLATAYTPIPGAFIEVEDAEPAEGSQFFQLTPISLDDARAAHLTGEPLNLTGQRYGALFNCRIMGTRQHGAIAQIQGTEDHRVLAAQTGGPAVSGGRLSAARLARPNNSVGIDLRNKLEFLSDGAMA